MNTDIGENVLIMFSRLSTLFEMPAALAPIKKLDIDLNLLVELISFMLFLEYLFTFPPKIDDDLSSLV